MVSKELTTISIEVDEYDERYLKGLPENEKIGTLFYIEWSVHDNGFYEIVKAPPFSKHEYGLNPLKGGDNMCLLSQMAVYTAVAPIRWRYAEPWECIYDI